MLHIAQRRLEEINRAIEQGVSNSDTFAGGQSGLTLYYYELYEATEKNEYKEKALALLTDVLQHFQQGEPKLIGSSFCSGAAGFAWVLQYLHKKQFIALDINAELADMDEYLFHSALSQMDNDLLDYLHGALGILHYFTFRMSDEKIRRYADTLIEKLNSKTVRDEKGLRFNSHISEGHEKETFNLGLSHGLSGILLILVNAWEYSEKKVIIEQMLEEGIRYLLHYRRDADYSTRRYNFFPFTVHKQTGEEMGNSRLAWCYGDLGEVLLLNRAGELLQQSNYTRLAQLIGLQTLMRKEQSATLVSDAHFCHGSSGLARFYRVLYDITGQQAYKTGSDYWIEQTLLYLEQEIPSGVYTNKEHDFLEGLLGVAFTLLSFTTEKKLTWSSSFLL